MTERVVRRRRTGGSQGFTAEVFRDEGAEQIKLEHGWSLMYFLLIFDEQVWPPITGRHWDVRRLIGLE